jgi:hypothetical protein
LRLVVVLLAVCTWPAPSVAQDGSPGTAQAPQAGRPLIAPDDRTGTNPLKLEPAVELANDLGSLPQGLFVNETAYRLAVPLFDRRMLVAADLPLVATDISGRTDFGFGDLRVDGRWRARLTDRYGLVVGAAASVSTATKDTLGLGSHTIAPFAIVVFGVGERTLFTPGYVHRVGVGTEEDRLDVHDGVLSLLLVHRFTAADWVSVDPRLTFDYEAGETWGGLDGEYGRVLMGGLSSYVRVGVGFADAREHDWRVAFGFRIVVD